ncbi:hypothetical protein SAMN06297144_3004 [Sphingomonas guangdongensis]|uniref:Uncharacterized protein n=1 Tax=Sphingomonas guangdongensis TaxID=1141890 RepID=A0A285R194_9SPHN|nr:hypothetical protein [Sphingomonas guangdongensis]SOB87866.1 hypothetical protein SAMN06297144_3004 [Sphingomonas guangdongensis]
MVRGALPIVLLALGLAPAASAQTASCLPVREAEALVLNLGPTLIDATVTTCTPALPAGAYLRRSGATLSARFARQNDASWPLAKEALRKIVGPSGASLLDSEIARSVVPAMVAPLVTQEIKAKDCPVIDRLLGQLDPLPAANTAALLVTVMQLAQAEQRTRPGQPRICPPGETR